jgi:hypothetical protein
VIAVSVFGLWCSARRSRRAGKVPALAPVEDEQAKPAPASPPCVVPCSGCGKHLKARGDLAGKRVKCPHCGQAVLVPAIKAAGPESRPGRAPHA